MCDQCRNLTFQSRAKNENRGVDFRFSEQDGFMGVTHPKHVDPGSSESSRDRDGAVSIGVSFDDSEYLRAVGNQGAGMS